MEIEEKAGEGDAAPQSGAEPVNPASAPAAGPAVEGVEKGGKEEGREPTPPAFALFFNSPLYRGLTGEPNCPTLTEDELFTMPDMKALTDAWFHVAKYNRYAIFLLAKTNRRIIEVAIHDEGFSITVYYTEGRRKGRWRVYDVKPGDARLFYTIAETVLRKTPRDEILPALEYCRSAASMLSFYYPCFSRIIARLFGDP